MTVNISQAQLQGFFSNFDATFSQAYEGTPSWHEQVARTYPSGTRTNVYAWLQRLPALRRWVGPRTINRLATYLYSLENVRYEDTFSVQREDIEDDIHGMFSDMLRLAGEQAKKWPDQQLATVIENGTSTVIYDGANFFDTSHPVNKYDGTVTARDGTTAQSNYKTNFALTPDNFATGRLIMRGWVGEDGKPLGVNPDTLMIPPELEYAAENILKAAFSAPQTVNGATQVGANENVLKGKCEILVVPELTNAKAWYLLCTKRPIMPFVFQQRYAPDMVPLVNATDPNVVNQDEYVWNIRARGAFGYGLWWLAFKGVAP